MQVFSTIKSPVFSELAVVVTSDTVTNLPWDLMFFKTLHRMNEIRPFKLEFLPDASDSHREKLRRMLEGALNLATAQGFLNLSSPYPSPVMRGPPIVDETRPSTTPTRYHLVPCNTQGVKWVPP